VVAEADQLVDSKGYEEDGQLPNRCLPLDPLPPLLVFLRDVLLNVPLLLVVQRAERAGGVAGGFGIVVIVTGWARDHRGPVYAILYEV
jgi:hypothetical protein